MFDREGLDIQNLIRYNMTILDEEGFCVSYRFCEAREKRGCLRPRQEDVLMSLIVR